MFNFHLLLICKQLRLSSRVSTSQRITGTFPGIPARSENHILCFVFFFCIYSFVLYEGVYTSSMSHGVQIKAWDDPFLNKKALHFDRSLTRHYLSLGASALLIQHPEDAHAQLQACTRMNLSTHHWKQLRAFWHLLEEYKSSPAARCGWTYLTYRAFRPNSRSSRSSPTGS